MEEVLTGATAAADGVIGLNEEHFPPSIVPLVESGQRPTKERDVTALGGGDGPTLLDIERFCIWKGRVVIMMRVGCGEREG